MEIKLELGEFSNPLLCPACGCENLHQTKVEVYFRPKEDATEGFSTSCSPYHATSDDSDDMFNNPSGRRDGLRIHFECEQCPATPKLTISQHKGTTYLAASYMVEVK